MQMNINKYLKELRKLLKKIDLLSYLKIIFMIISVVLSQNNLFFITNAALVFSILNSFVRKENDKFERKFIFDFEIFTFQCFTLFYLNRQTLLMGIKLFDIEYFSKIILNAGYLNGELMFLILFGLLYIFIRKKSKAYKSYVCIIVLYFCLFEDVFYTGFSLLGIHYLIGLLFIFVNIIFLQAFIDFVIISLAVLYFFMKENKNYKLVYLLLVFCYIFRLSLAVRIFL